MRRWLLILSLLALGGICVASALADELPVSTEAVPLKFVVAAGGVIAAAVAALWRFLMKMNEATRHSVELQLKLLGEAAIAQRQEQAVERQAFLDRYETLATSITSRHSTEVSQILLVTAEQTATLKELQGRMADMLTGALAQPKRRTRRKGAGK